MIFTTSYINKEQLTNRKLLESSCAVIETMTLFQPQKLLVEPQAIDKCLQVEIQVFTYLWVWFWSGTSWHQVTGVIVNKSN